MDLQQWKQAAEVKLAALAGNLRAGAPEMLYGALSAATLMPVVTAANRGDFAALTALGGVVGGIGGNLIANQIQGWKEQSDAEVAADLEAKAKAEPEWRQALDTLLREFEAPRVVQVILSEADRDWFVERLRTEFAQLGSGLTLDNNGMLVMGDRNVTMGGDVRDSTVITGDSNVVAETGGGAYVGGDVTVEGGDFVGRDKTVHGDTVEGDQITVHQPTAGQISVGGRSTEVQAEHYVVAEEGGSVFIGQAQTSEPAFDSETALGRYLAHVVSRNRFLQLQGIRSGGKLVHIELDRIYVRLHATQDRRVLTEEHWLAEAQALAPGEAQRRPGAEETAGRSAMVSVEEALSEHRRLVVLGDPGSGKTTLMRYLALLYARDLANEESRSIAERLGLDESGYLPLLLPCRQIGDYLRAQSDNGIQGHGLLLDFFRRALASDRIRVTEKFFDEWLESGRAVVLLDGLDEVADVDLRRQVARTLEWFVQAYPQCRYVVTSRIVGYKGAARLSEQFVTTTVRDFSLADIEQFLESWHRLVATGLMQEPEAIDAYTADQTAQLMAAISESERIRELAINPLMLTVIAMVHRDRVRLPDRRAELYAEAVDVLLGKWDEARGVQEIAVLADRPFDTGDKRLLVQSIALHMHEQKRKELEIEELRLLLTELFHEMVPDARAAALAGERFLQVAQERMGLLSARGEGVFAFTHLTFQEYLAALGVAAQDDYVNYTLMRTNDAWWREVILLEAGYLSTQSKERTTTLVQAIADHKQEPEPYHNLVLAADCLHDVGGSRVTSNLEDAVLQQLRVEIEMPQPLVSRLRGESGRREWMTRRSLAVEAWARAGGGYWSGAYGEPEWMDVPAGEFWMGSDEYLSERPVHSVHVPAFRIARVPITNAQYGLFVKATNHHTPDHWEDKRPPKRLGSHPVTYVSWDDAVAYCEWLSERLGLYVRLPSEAEWEKVARGDQDQRVYPWGNEEPDASYCNFNITIGRTTPVGIYPAGESPYGCLDMSGNVWEWARSLYADYPYDAEDGREDVTASGRRVVRGGSFLNLRVNVRCAFRLDDDRDSRLNYVGFRVVAPGL